jgi:hypothetical protein
MKADTDPAGSGRRRFVPPPHLAAAPLPQHAGGTVSQGRSDKCHVGAGRRLDVVTPTGASGGVDLAAAHA